MIKKETVKQCTLEFKKTKGTYVNVSEQLALLTQLANQPTIKISLKGQKRQQNKKPFKKILQIKKHCPKFIWHTRVQ